MNRSKMKVKPFNGNMTEYTENTTIHGVKYLGERRPLAEKIFWIMIFICCISILGYFIYQIIDKWNRCPIILVEDEEPTDIYKIPFPAVTICPQIKMKYEEFNYEQLMPFFTSYLKKENVDEVFANQTQKVELAQQICNDLLAPRMIVFSKLTGDGYINSSYIPFLYSSAPTLEETIIEAEYTITKVFDEQPSTNLFSTILTNEGVCFTFNTVKEILRNEGIQKDYKYYDIEQPISNWDSETGYNLKNSNGNGFYPFNHYGSGKYFKLQVSFRSKTGDMNKICQPTKIGFKIKLHEPTEYPTTFDDEYISIGYQSTVNLAVRPKIVKTSNDLRDIDANRRQCYFNDEKKLKYFAFYNKANCKLECFANQSLDMHRCVHFSLPMAPNTPICGAKTVNNEIFSALYDWNENTESFRNMGKDTGNSKFIANDFNSCQCLQECNSIKYDHTIESVDLDIQRLLQLGSSNETVKPYYLPTKINIFFDDVRVMGKTRSKLFTLGDLVSNFGGLMGLFMGASILSLFEFIYFCAIRHCCKRKITELDDISMN